MPAFDTMVTRFPKGVTNASQYQTLGDYGKQDPSWACEYFNDFLHNNSASELTATLGGTATATGLQGNYDGGAYRWSTSTGTTDSVWLQLPQATFKPELGKAMFFKWAGIFTGSMSVTGVFGAGFAPTGAGNPQSLNNAIWFYTTSTGLLNFKIVSNAVTLLDVSTGYTVVSGTAFEVGIEIDELGNICAYVNPTTGKTNVANAQPKGYVAQLPYSTSLATLFTNVQTPFATINNQSIGSSKTLDVDFIFAAKHR